MITDVLRYGSVVVQVGGVSYPVPYYYNPDLCLEEIPENIELPDDLHRPHKHFNVIETNAEPDWNPKGVERRLEEIRARGEDMFLVGMTASPDDTDLAIVYTAPAQGDIV